MKKKLIVVAMLLFAICFSGFAKEAITAESSQYIAKGSKKTETQYTVVVQADVYDDEEENFEVKTETFIIVAENRKVAENEAIRKFKDLYARGYNHYTGHIKRIVVRCSSIDNACRM